MGEDPKPTLPTRREGPDDAGPATRSGSAFDPPPVRFVEAAELGRGGMGRVVEAVDRALARPVAIKQALTTDTNDLLRFEREVRITARLQHPNIVPILDAGRDPDGRPYYVMRKVDGRPLADLVEEAATVRERLALVPNVLAAVDAAAYAHANGVIHRDIKPWNVLVGEFGETLLIDWGLARELGSTELDRASGKLEDGDGLTRAGKAFGTPGFMPPEQARGEAPDRRVDVYALGATLYHVLAGAPPLDGTSGTEAIDAAAANRGPELDKLSSEIPAELIAIVGKAMQPDRALRYADATELASDLRRFLAGQLVAAHDYSAAERLAKFVRKHRVAVAIGALSLIAIGVTAIVAVRNILDERDAAELARAEAETARASSDNNRNRALLGRAQSLLAVDPATAVAVLKHLEPDSEWWTAAEAIAAAAVASGIPHGYHAHDGEVVTLVFSPDGKRLLSAGRDGVLVVAELDRGTRKVVARFPTPLVNAVWTSNTTIAAIGDRSGIDLVDLDGTQSRIVPDHAISQIEMWRGRLLALTLDHVLIDSAVPDRPLAKEIYYLLVTRQILVVGDGEHLRWMNPDGTFTTLLDTKLDGWAQLAASDSGQRFAIDLGQETHEWKLVDDHPVAGQHWLTDTGRHVSPGSLMYVGDQLFVLDHTTQWQELIANGQRKLANLPHEAARGRTRNGWLIGNLNIYHPLDGSRLVLNRGVGTTHIAGHADSSWVAVASSFGDVRIWNLAIITPQRIDLDWMPSIFEGHRFDGRVLWFSDLQAVHRLDIETRKVVSFPASGLPDVCFFDDGGIATLNRKTTQLIRWSSDAKRRDVDENALLMACSETGAVVVREDGEVVHYSPDRRSIARLDKAHAVDASGRWLAIATADRVIRRDFVTGQEQELELAAANRLGLDPDGSLRSTTLAIDGLGTVYADTPAGLVRWDGASTTTLPIRRVLEMYPRPDGGVLVMANYVLYDIGAKGSILRSSPVAANQARISADMSTYASVSPADGGILAFDLTTGVYRTHMTTGSPTIAITSDGLQIAGIHPSNTPPIRVRIWKHATRPPGITVRAWLDQLTEATVPEASDVVMWP